MSRPRKVIPSYRLHRQSGQAVVTLSDGLGVRRDVLLGKYDSPASHAEYARIIAEWKANGHRLSCSNASKADITINELILAYYRFAEGYYQKNGKPTSQLDRVKLSLKPVRELYGHTLVRDFGPLALKAVQDVMVRADWVRRYVNHCVGCIKRMFKWGVANELVPASVLHGLQSVEGLKKGRCKARESKPVRPVADEHVDATMPYLTRPVQAMVQVQWFTGARPGEVTIMRPCDIDRTGTAWLYRPESHKTEHHGSERTIFLGPQAQAIVQPFLFRDPGAYLFSPKEALEDLRARQRQARKSKVQPSQVCRKKRKPKRTPGVRYLVASYGQAVTKGIEAANKARACKDCKKLKPADRCEACQANAIPHWHPHQLRHTKATEIRREAGLDAARAVLGHRSAAITETYAEIDMGKAAEVMERLG